MLSGPDKNSSLPSHVPDWLPRSEVVAGEDFYQQLHNRSNTIISLQYKHNQFLKFRINDVEQGEVVDDDVEGIGLLCWINKKTYFLNRQHLDQMSNRECWELFNHLGIDGSKIFKD